MYTAYIGNAKIKNISEINKAYFHRKIIRAVLNQIHILTHSEFMVIVELKVYVAGFFLKMSPKIEDPANC